MPGVGRRYVHGDPSTYNAELGLCSWVRAFALGGTATGKAWRRHTEIFGEVLHGEEAIGEFHSRILLRDPLTRVSVTLSPESQDAIRQTN